MYTDEMVSFGAGINSVAMVVRLVEQGWRGPIVFADTGGEHPDTYCYLRYFQEHFLDQHGLTIVTLEPGSPYHGPKAQLPLEQYCLKQHLIPLLAVRWCSFEYKRTPLQNWAQEHAHDTQLLGISASEPNRVRNDPTVAYPLVEEGIHRPECRRIIEAAGLLVPKKSGCFFCPGQSISGWKNMFYEYPDLYERSVTLEKNASEHVGRSVTLDPHQVSLEDHAKRRWQGQRTMDLSEWLPCACTL